MSNLPMGGETENNMKKAKLLFAFGGGFLVLFLALIGILMTVDVGSVSAADLPVGLSSFNREALEAIGKNETAYLVSEVLGTALLLIPIAFALLGAWQLAKGRSLAAVDRSIYCLGGTYVVLAACYLFFEIFVINFRPVTVDQVVSHEASFPSSHTLLAVTIGFTAAIWLADKLQKRGILRVLLPTLVAIVSVLTVVMRALAGVHWITDIIGGLLLSGALVCFEAGASAMLCRAVHENTEES